MHGIDLFCGAGGMSLGATQAGIKIVVAAESDQHAALTYSKNHSQVNLITKDIRRIAGNYVNDLLPRTAARILFGGAPCQGFSYSNLRTRSERNQNNWLFLDFLRIARAVAPEWIVFENVRGFENTTRGIFVEELGNRLDGMGYRVVHALLNTKDFRLPQDRARFFLVANRNGIDFQFPKPLCSIPPTVRDAISDLPILKNGAAQSWMPYRTAARTSYAKSLRNGQSGSANHFVSRNAQFVVARYPYIPQGRQLGGYSNANDAKLRRPSSLSHGHLSPTALRCAIDCYRKFSQEYAYPPGAASRPVSS